MKKTTKRKEGVLIAVILAIFLMGIISAANPVSPDSVDYGSNETKAAASAKMVNLSGGRILSMNITANTQNPRWKAFIGNVFGSFTLDDQSGSTIYDWTLSSITGRIYATRTAGAVSWASIECANDTTLAVENTNMHHNNTQDNVTATFSDTTHDTFWVGGVSIDADSCPTLNTYVNNVSNQSAGQPFEEMVLYEPTPNFVYATIIEEDETGYDGANYDFQMIVPEDGAPSFNSSTAYYLYVEIGT